MYTSDILLSFTTSTSGKNLVNLYHLSIPH